jgi:hypothetical protein
VHLQTRAALRGSLRSQVVAQMRKTLSILRRGYYLLALRIATFSVS